MFCLEVHSGKQYINIAKSIANVVDLLRLLHCFYPDVAKGSGFVFTNLPKMNLAGSVMDKNISCVTQLQYK